MVRYLLVLLAVLVAVLAFLFDRSWLWIGAGVIFAGGVGLVAWRLWTAFWTDGDISPRPSTQSEASDESLEDLGIVDIRPQEDTATKSTAPSGRDGGERAGSRSESKGAESSEDHPATNAPSDSTQSASNETRETTPTGPVVTDDALVLGPLLLSLRAALEAQTVCLLVQEEVALTYRIEALASIRPGARTAGTFDTQTPLVTASMSRHSVTMRTLAETELAIEDLGYYEAPPNIDHLAVAPLPRPDEPSTTFLLADATKGTDLGARWAQNLIEHFAETVDLLLSRDKSELEVPSRKQQGRSEEASGAMPTADAVPESEEGPGETPRPRREIVAEEIEAAEGASGELALVLVHLNRAESIARRGDEAVASAERLFRARLEHVAPNQRVERFGELTYGLFFRGGANAVEPWVTDLEQTLSHEEGELEGGVSVGVAVWDDHDAETLRTDATDALHEAYKTGTSTIVT